MGHCTSFESWRGILVHFGTDLNSESELAIHAISIQTTHIQVDRNRRHSLDAEVE